MNYGPLRIKSSYSLLSSLVDINKLVKKSVELNYSSLCLCDINNMYGTMSFYKECKKNNIKPVLGVEFTYEEGIIILYAKDYIGYKNLVKLTTIKSKEDLKLEDLENYKSNLVLVGLYDYIDTFNKIEYLYENSYIAYDDISIKSNINKTKRIYMNNIIALNKEDVNYLQYAYKIKDNITIHDINKTNNNYLLTKEEYTTIVDIDEENNYNQLINLCNVEFVEHKLNLPNYTNGNSYDYLVSLAIKGLNKRLNNSVGVNYIERLKYELDIINEMGFCNYFLVVFDFVTYAKKNNILVGPGRGSAAGSLVSYVLGITNVDPIKYDLYFERFLNPKRISMPDIDIDFDSDKRDLVIDYVRNKYGIKNACEIITFGTLAPRQVIRDVGKILNIPTSKIDMLSGLINPNISLMDNYNNTKVKQIIDSSDMYKELFDIALHLENLPRHTSIHAAGVIICNDQIDEYIPLKYENDRYLSGYTSEHLEEFGLLKMDFLGLKNLSMIDSIVENVKKNENIVVDLNKISYYDQKVIDVFKNTNTLGIFQFESSGMKNFLRKLRASSFDEVIAAIALYRPGPMENIPTFIARKNNQEKVDFITDQLEPILKQTYGVIIYQEQIMKIANIIAGFDLGEADILRKAMSKKNKDLILNLANDFVEGAIKKGYTKSQADEIFQLVLKFASYGFNKAHSVSYAMIAYQIAYLKVYHPKEFYSSLFTLVSNSPLKLKEAITEARNYGINILYPNINNSSRGFKPEENGVRFALTVIKNIGIAAIETITSNAPYDNFLDFLKKCYSKTVNKKNIEALIFAGCFDIFGHNKKTLIENLDNNINYVELTSEITLDFIEKPVIIPCDEYEKEILIQKEKELFGFYITMHPVNKYKTNSDINISEIDSYFDKYITLIALVDSIKIVDTKNNEKMMFITLSDDTSNIDGVVFSKTLENNNNFFRDNIVKVKGKIEKRFDKYQIICNDIEVLE